ncbi:NAD+ synthase [Candidatus Aerophobetes bacterium]|nr:NAD+ synthase [Candidatus Aerophobetes bacterium]
MGLSFHELCDKISSWIKEKCARANAKGAVFGLSGGVDSATVAALCRKALGENTLAIIMPCYSNPADRECAIQVAEKFNIKYEIIYLEEVFDSFLKILPKGNKIATANLKPRIRMTTLYYFANNLNYIVVGAGNKSEIMVGYFTKYGDGGADIFPIGGLLKTEVIELAKFLGVPKNIIEKPPSAGLWPGQTDEEEMGITYQELDKIIRYLEGGEKIEVSQEKLEKVKILIERSIHKRKSPDIFDNF